MKKSPFFKSVKAFTLIEIMVAVVIIGLLASMAIPAFNRIRRQSRQTVMISDGRAIGSAAQQYFMTTGQSAVKITYDSSTGEISGDLRPWLTAITRNYTFDDDTVDGDRTDSFSFSLPSAFGGTPLIFTAEGRTTVLADQ